MDPILCYLEVAKRNIKNAIWRYGDFLGKENMNYGQFKDLNLAKLSRVSGIAMMWTSGKDSTIVLWVIRNLFNGRVPMDVIFVDTGFQFQELLEFRDKIVKEWNLNLVVAKNNEVLNVVKEENGRKVVYAKDLSDRMREKLRECGWEKDYFEISKNPACCHLLKTVPFQETLKEKGYKAVIESIRWDEQEERSTSRYFAEGSGWVDHIRVRPTVFLTYEETRKLLFGNYGIPRNPMYDKGYTSLGCYPCTSIPKTTEIERAGRSAQKEQMMARLQALGYHGGEKK